jgi:thiol-disulfide isomerase/thioredoxin
MKPIFTTLFLLSIQFLQAQQTITIGGSGAFQSNNSVAVKKGIAIGQQAPDIKFSGLLNAPKDETSLSELKGKIVILEFWATWCVPCLPAMDHLKELKDKFPGNLVVIGILYDKTERLERYIKNKPSSLWHIADPESRFNEFFPHRSVPHSVIIDQSGKVVAITAPENITEKVISDLVRNQPVQLPEKEDHVGENFEPSKDIPPDSGRFCYGKTTDVRTMERQTPNPDQQPPGRDLSFHLQY